MENKIEDNVSEEYLALETTILAESDTTCLDFEVGVEDMFNDAQIDADIVAEEKEILATETLLELLEVAVKVGFDDSFMKLYADSIREILPEFDDLTENETIAGLEGFFSSVGKHRRSMLNGLNRRLSSLWENIISVRVDLITWRKSASSLIKTLRTKKVIFKSDNKEIKLLNYCNPKFDDLQNIKLILKEGESILSDPDDAFKFTNSDYRAFKTAYDKLKSSNKGGGYSEWKSIDTSSDSADATAKLVVRQLERVRRQITFLSALKKSISNINTEDILTARLNWMDGRKNKESYIDPILVIARITLGLQKYIVVSKMALRSYYRLGRELEVFKEGATAVKAEKDS